MAYIFAKANPHAHHVDEFYEQDPNDAMLDYIRKVS